MSSLNWSQIIAASAPMDMERISLLPAAGNIFQIHGSTIYCQVHKRVAGRKEEGKFAVIFYWIPSEAALRKLCFEDIKAIDVMDRPPKEILLDGWRLSYQDIIGQTSLKEFKITPVLRQGRAYYTGVHAERFSYYFDGIKEFEPTARPFVISIDLRGIRWAQCT